jgi:hypothetical protein
MLGKIKFAAGLGAAVTILGIIIGVSLKQRPAIERVDVLDRTASHPLTQNPTTVSDEKIEFGPDTNPLPEIMPALERNEHPMLNSGPSTGLEELAILDSLDFSDVRDVELDFDRAILATAGGVLEVFTDDSSFAIYSYPQELHDFDCFSVVTVEDDILVGTACGVYRIDGLGVVQHVWPEITDTVTVLKNCEGFVYVGTRNHGLYEVDGNIVTQLLQNKHVIDVSDDNFALWCATAEDGLLYRDENGWHKRYLLSNPEAFANVTALESAFGKLWVGTPSGLFIFNGDNWERLDSADYLLEEGVTALAAGKSYMYIGTDKEGVFAYCNGFLSPLDWSDNLPVRSLSIYDGKYLVGLDKGGALLNTSKGVVDILPLVHKAQSILSSL